LSGNRTARFLFPLPYFFDEGVSSQIVSAFTFCLKLPLDHHLGCNTRVVCSNLPQCVETLHAMVANQGIHDCLLEAVPHVQAAGDIGRGNHDAVGVFSALGGKIACFLPGLVPTGFNLCRLERLFHKTVNPGKGIGSDTGCLGQKMWDYTLDLVEPESHKALH
jgi:hypothetical protein